MTGTLTPEGAQKQAIHVWDGSAWRKPALLWGYYDRWVQTVNVAASGAGDAEIETTAVSPDYVYVLQALSAYHDADANKKLAVLFMTGAVSVAVVSETAAVSGEDYMWNGEVVLKEGDTVKAWAFAPGDGKKVYLAVWGYKMKIAE